MRTIMWTTVKTKLMAMQEYERFMSEMVEACQCRPENCPCDGVLAGGMCDMEIEEEEQPDENDEK